MSSRRSTCRSCGAGSLKLIHDFGLQPLAGEFFDDPVRSVNCKRYPLDLQRCDQCDLVQIVELPPIEEIFNEEYKYATGTIPSLVKHFEGYSVFLDDILPRHARVLEFGCNDGTLLAMLKARGHEVVGVDASRNVAQMAAGKDILVFVDFFTPELVLREGLSAQFDLVTCSNVFAHIDSLHDASRAAWLALKKGGRFCVEVHDAEKLFSLGQFDSIYHEHLTYFSAKTLERHLGLFGFKPVAYELTAMHGGGLRVVTEKTEALQQPGPRQATLEEQSFDATVQRCKRDVERLKVEHTTLCGYGAAGRSQMFINMTRTQGLFDQVFDDSALRQNKYIIGSSIPIRAFDGHKRSGACLILAWNYADVIIDRISECFDAVYVVLPDLRRLS